MTNIYAISLYIILHHTRYGDLQYSQEPQDSQHHNNHRTWLHMVDHQAPTHSTCAKRTRRHQRHKKKKDDRYNNLKEVHAGVAESTAMQHAHQDLRDRFSANLARSMPVMLTMTIFQLNDYSVIKTCEQQQTRVLSKYCTIANLERVKQRNFKSIQSLSKLSPARQ